MHALNAHQEGARLTQLGLKCREVDVKRVVSVSLASGRNFGQLALPLSDEQPKVEHSMQVAVQRRKELGAYYTPRLLADKLAAWAVRSSDDRVLDPSCGGLAFLAAAGARLEQLGCDAKSVPERLFGVDLDANAIDAAIREYSTLVRAANLHLCDFFDLESRAIPKVDVLLGNPPYIRYQGFNPSAARSRELATAQGVRLTRLASSWAPFVVHGASFVKQGGRMAQVLPAELLHAQYAAEILEFLRSRFGHIAIVVFEDRVFPGAQEEVVLLCADDCGAPGVADIQLISCEDIEDFEPSAIGATRSGDSVAPPAGRSALIAQLLPSTTSELVALLAEHEKVDRFGELASVDIGVVTGANEFFVLARANADKISAALLQPAVSKAAHVAGARITQSDHLALLEAGASVSMFVADGSSAPADLETAWPHIASGEARGFDERYKCRIRNPWWSLPLPKAGVPDLLLTYCSNEHPRLALNDAGVLHTNTLHGVQVFGDIEPAVLAVGFFNSLTMLSAELAGRSYGGGVLKLEPSEAEALLVPNLSSPLADLLPAVDKAIRARDLEAACDLVDPIVLIEGLGLSEEEVAELRAGRERLRQRRKRRGKAAVA